MTCPQLSDVFPPLPFVSHSHPLLLTSKSSNASPHVMLNSRTYAEREKKAPPPPANKKNKIMREREREREREKERERERE